jgi:hypothetical protein
MSNIKIEGTVNPEALARYQGQLAEAQARIQLANTELSGIQMKVNAGTATANDLNRLKLLQKNVPKYEEAYKSLEKDTRALSGGGGVKQFAGNAVGFAVRSVAIRAGINVLSQAVSKDGEVNLGEAVSFVTEPRFWTGSAGAFLGSMLGSTIGNVIFPGGGALLSALPGFLGAAAGYELGAGNLDRTNWTQLFASSAASALAFGAIGGPVGIVASIAAGFVVNKLFDKSDDSSLMPAMERKPEWLALESMQPTTSYEPYASFSEDLNPEAAAQPGGFLIPAPEPSTAAEAVQSVAVENVVVPQAEIDELAEKVRQHYERYIGFVRGQNAGAASAEYKVYTQYKTQLDNMRARYGL